MSTERTTVGGKIANLERHYRQVELDQVHVAPERKNAILAEINMEIASLAEWPEEMPLLTLAEAQQSDELDDEAKFAIRWQRRHDYSPSSFEEALFAFIDVCDKANLERLTRAFPEVDGVRAWRYETGYARRLRSLPLAFSL